jgi:hypothetical protein
MMMSSLIALTAAVLVLAQQPRQPTAASVMGSYGLGTRQLPSPKHDTGCWLETAPLTADSVRVQIRCATPSPSHHFGVLDERLAFRQSRVAYETTRFNGPCRISIRFADARAIVAQDGTSAACGFGANVNVGGSYGRITSRRPEFDLAPIAR